MLGFFWSFVNPLLLLLVYSFVFTVVIDRGADALEPFALFLFCGLLPWTWFSSALLESSTALISGGNLIRKVLFPAEVLPIVAVLGGLVHFLFGLPVLGAFFAYYGRAPFALDLLWLPVLVIVQLALTLGLALILSALTVHFRDIRDLLANLLTLWFFGTPIVYSLADVPASLRPLLNLNPFTHLAVAYQEVLFVTGPFTGWPRVALVGAAACAVLALGFVVFDRLRDTLAEEV